MSERIVSPGTFTNENDLSFLPRGIAEIGGTVIGRTPKGRAFVPTVVSNFDEFRRDFGEKNTEYSVPYLADEYLRNAGTLTVVRVLGSGTFTYTNVGELTSGSTLLAVIRPTASASGDYAVTVTGSTPTVSMSNFDLIVSESHGATTYTGVSLRKTDSNYIGKLLGTDSKGTNYFYVDHVYEETVSSSLADYDGLLDHASGTNVTSSTSATITTTGYSNASSPTVISQGFGSGSATTHELFKFYTLSDGTDSNKEVKISIFDIKPSGSVPGSDYGAFSLAVRKYSDTDKNINVVETFTNLNLDPNSPNYVAKRIGDMYQTIDSDGEISEYGDYENLSKYVRIEMKPLGSVPKEAVPFGFKNYYKYNSSAPDIAYKTSQSIGGVYSEKAYFGVDFDENVDVGNYHTALPTNKATVSVNFRLENCASYSGGTYGGSLTVNSDSTEKQFTFGLQDGFDGFDPRLNVENQTTYTTATTSGSVAYRKGIDVVKDPERYDFNLMVIPEINYREGSAVLDYAIDAVESRGDAFLIMDLGPKGDSISTVVNTSKTIDSSYAAAYYPYIQLYDETNSKNVWVSPSVVMPGVVAYTDKVAHEWYAPAGFNRGGLTRVRKIEKKLKRTQRDTLYAGRVNPIAYFPDVGPAVYGQKTLQTKPSALDRINVRRLLIKIKKTVASITKYMVFEQNNEDTWTLFRNSVNPILDGIKRNQGLYDFRVVMDDSTNTPDVIDRNEMRGAVYLKPTKTSEYIIIDFNILPTGATFNV